MTNSDVIIIGAGAAGLMCAIEAGQRGRKVALLEHGERLGKKILISGGGRCNFTNLGATAENYVSNQSNFCKSALARYTPSDFIALVEKHGIQRHEKKLGQIFCNHRSRQIVDLLEKECREAGVDIRLNCRVDRVFKTDRFQLETNQGEWSGRSLVVATGGLSFPKLGATDFGYRIARQFGLKVEPPRPGLVPLTFSSPERAWFAELSGISIDAAVSASGRTFRENILFTHRGLSGPAILQISNYLPEGESLRVDLLPGRSSVELLASLRGREWSAVLGEHLPRRFIQSWSRHFAPTKTDGRHSQRHIQQIVQGLRRWELRPDGTEGYGKAEVTLGGVSVAELSSKTMESRRIPGLFFIGEIVDVTGWLGGYNFQWAWASGNAAGKNV